MLIRRPTRPTTHGSHCLERRFTSPHANIQLPVSFKGQGHAFLLLVTRVAIPIQEQAKNQLYPLAPHLPSTSYANSMLHPTVCKERLRKAGNSEGNEEKT